MILGRGSFTESYPAVRLRPLGLRRAVRGQARLFVEVLKPGGVTWSGSHARAAAGPDDLSASRERDAARLGRRRRQSRVGRPRRALRTAADARDHRRQPGALQAVRRPLSPVAQAARAARSADSRAFARTRGRDRRTGEGAAVAALPGDVQRASAANAAGRRPRGSSSSAKPALDGALCVGSPETVATKIARTVKALGLAAVQREIQRRHPAARR